MYTTELLKDIVKHPRKYDNVVIVPGKADAQKMLDCTYIKLRCVFLNTVKVGRKIARQTESNNVYCYYGKTKKECIEKAKKAFRYSSLYKKTLSTEIIED